MLDKIFIKDLNVKLMDNQNKQKINQLSENVKIPLNILNLHRSTDPPILWHSEKVHPYKPEWGPALISGPSFLMKS